LRPSGGGALVNRVADFVDGQRRPHLTGFTLLETVMVLALVGILVVMVLPSYSNYASNQRALATARTLASDLRVARQEAVTRRATIAVTFAASDASCLPRTAAASYAVTHASSVIKRTCFPADVEWSPLPTGSLMFRSVGAPQAGTTLTVRSTRTGKRHVVTVAAETGAVIDDTQ